MKNLIFLILFLGLSYSGYSQNYNSAVGLRLGYPTSVTYKKFISENHALEFYGGIRSYFGFTNIHLNAAYLIHNDIESVDNLQWYYGGGGGVILGDGYTAIDINGYLGLEYTFEDIPLSLSLDWVPTFVLGHYGLSGFGGGYGALAARYILNSDNF